MRILAVDPGDVRIGLAISDPSGTIARPLKTLIHQSRAIDARRIVEEAEHQDCGTIVVGLALDEQGLVSHQATKALRLVDAIRMITDLRVTTWDESGSTQQAERGGISAENLDARAAAIFLQDFLESNER